MTTCRNCNNTVKSKKFKLWATPTGHAYACSERCFAEMNGEELPKVKKVKIKKHQRIQDEDEW